MTIIYLSFSVGLHAAPAFEQPSQLPHPQELQGNVTDTDSSCSPTAHRVSPEQGAPC